MGTAGTMGLSHKSTREWQRSVRIAPGHRECADAGLKSPGLTGALGINSLNHRVHLGHMVKPVYGVLILRISQFWGVTQLSQKSIPGSWLRVGDHIMHKLVAARICPPGNSGAVLTADARRAIATAHIIGNHILLRCQSGLKADRGDLSGSVASSGPKGRRDGKCQPRASHHGVRHRFSPKIHEPPGVKIRRSSAGNLPNGPSAGKSWASPTIRRGWRRDNSAASTAWSEVIIKASAGANTLQENRSGWSTDIHGDTVLAGIKIEMGDPFAAMHSKRRLSPSGGA